MLKETTNSQKKQLNDDNAGPSVVLAAPLVSADGGNNACVRYSSLEYQYDQQPFESLCLLAYLLSTDHDSESSRFVGVFDRRRPG